MMSSDAQHIALGIALGNAPGVGRLACGVPPRASALPGRGRFDIGRNPALPNGARAT